MEKYTYEIEGQKSFYNSYLKRINNTLTMEDVLSDNNDGVINGNLIEFKLTINDLNSTLFQAIKYLSSMRLKGKSIPKNIVLISLNENKAYVYESYNYLDSIETIYIGSSSKNSSGFQSLKSPLELNLNKTIEVEGIKVSPNDLIFGDNDGIIVIPKKHEDMILKRVFEVIKTENNILVDIANGVDVDQLTKKHGFF